MTRRIATSRLWESLGFLSFWNGAYLVAATVVLARLSSSALSFRLVVVAFLTGQGTYLMDRVKPHASLVDEADRQADPARWAFLTPRAPRLRLLVLSSALLSAILAATLHPLAAVLIVLAYGGTALYGSSGGRRPKDVLLVKNLLVGLAIPSFAAVLLLACGGSWKKLVGASMPLVAVVTVDAMLCDLPDLSSDRAFGTRTLPQSLGRRGTWAMAVVAMVGIGLACLTLVAGWRAPFGYVFFGGLGPSTILLSALAERSLRDAVDLRLAALAAAAWVVS